MEKKSFNLWKCYINHCTSGKLGPYTCLYYSLIILFYSVGNEYIRECKVGMLSLIICSLYLSEGKYINGEALNDGE